jgi:hypothetical protein
MLACLVWLASAAVAHPLSEPLLPKRRVVSYYGNPLDKRMGILGEPPVDEMLARLSREAEEWAKADPSHPVQPALELVATVAADYPGEDGLYRTRMPDRLIEKVIGWAHRRGWIVILDVQVGRSTVRAEVLRLAPFLGRPDVHLAIDPEFQMRRGLRPGKLVGSSDAEDVNVAAILLSEIAVKRFLPPKLLLVHRFTDDMLKRYTKVRRDPNVQIVVVMDGYGTPSGKKRIYRREVAREPVQFAGLKLFYKNDKPMLTKSEVLGLEPPPLVVIYQ